MYRAFTDPVMQDVIGCVSPVPGDGAVTTTVRSTRPARAARGAPGRSAPRAIATRHEESCGDVPGMLRLALGPCVRVVARVARRAARVLESARVARRGISTCGGAAAPSSDAHERLRLPPGDSRGARDTTKGAPRNRAILGLTERAASSMNRYRELPLEPSCELRSDRVMGGRRASRPRPCAPQRSACSPARRRALPQRRQRTLKPPAPARWSTSCVRA